MQQIDLLTKFLKTFCFANNIFGSSLDSRRRVYVHVIRDNFPSRDSDVSQRVKCPNKRMNLPFVMLGVSQNIYRISSAGGLITLTWTIAFAFCMFKPIVHNLGFKSIKTLTISVYKPRVIRPYVKRDSAKSFSFPIYRKRGRLDLKSFLSSKLRPAVSFGSRWESRRIKTKRNLNAIQFPGQAMMEQASVRVKVYVS